ncbi:iron response transcriptional regulator IrrA [Pararhodospirillum oryzae]|uniref:Ferric uptake regulation protein n=1 Tax=Pararhodospirillum oryzae TaxID=478448 RepID=A0A512HA37_9PROT|nr:Fur family transcriptional regulator [Pararhodospirillum oryzae]GEO82323.1 transcriptional repressor [Pararhodospirillum oryzae]
MNHYRPYRPLLDKLRAAGLRPTRQRLALARLMFESGTTRHVTAETLHNEAMAANVSVSLATVYNTLHQFTEGGLLREVVVDPGRSYFDTNTTSHHHFYFEESGMLIDIPAADVAIARLPDIPDGATVRSVDLIIRLAACA